MMCRIQHSNIDFCASCIAELEARERSYESRALSMLGGSGSGALQMAMRRRYTKTT